MAGFAIESGSDLVGDLVADDAQAAALPLVEDSEDAALVASFAEEAWQAMTATFAAGSATLVPTLGARMQQVLNRLRASPSAASAGETGHCGNGTSNYGESGRPFQLCASHATRVALPPAIIDNGVSQRGYIGKDASVAPVMQVLLSQGCPTIAEVEEGEGITELL